MTPDELAINFGSVDLPWPDATDTLHGQGTDRTSTVYLGWGHRQDGVRAMAFKDAAAVLAETIATRGTHRPELDLLAYPLLFCWRHYVELELKHLVRSARRLLDEKPDPKEKPHHHLRDLWTECNGLLERIDDRKPDDYRNAGRLILQLDALDPDGQHFRYAWTTATKKRPPTATLAGVDKLAIDRVHAALMGLATFLEAAEAQIDDLTQALPER
jgi:hypothetical protein